jgi:hypothetical protein
MPLDVRLKHLIGLVGEIRPKPLIYAIPAIGITSATGPGSRRARYVLQTTPTVIDQGIRGAESGSQGNTTGTAATEELTW